ncbi:hypothetical protein P3T27_008099 [Kitasatospora sp. MAA19]|uniref:hypothetical protein n=1 Tax=unclassified Kitasatospora TaxID=2633591 RepID=UPI0024741775|nr:hypothetical protein [Kitasatospora sp. MAA19]MDH6711341.1 hypothetical protein [Kitasatospora sp. MAA19]
MTTTPRHAELAKAVTAVAADQRASWPELTDAEVVQYIRHCFFVVEDSPTFVYTGVWGVSATAEDPLEQAYASVVRATPEELARVLTS